LSQARQSNLLRHWIKAESGSAPTQAQLQALLSQVEACRTRGHDIELKVSAGYVTRDGERLAFQSNL
jgi:tRNA(Ile)-lysidine synthase